MSVEVLDGSTIISFLKDEEAFDSCVCKRFAWLDANHDGLLSYDEMLRELQSLRVVETHFGVDIKTGPEELACIYDCLFLQFDPDSSGTVDLQEFKAETKRMLLAMANGPGFFPVQMLLEEDSFLRTQSSSCPLKWQLLEFIFAN